MPPSSNSSSKFSGAMLSADRVLQCQKQFSIVFAQTSIVQAKIARFIASKTFIFSGFGSLLHNLQKTMIMHLESSYRSEGWKILHPNPEYDPKNSKPNTQKKQNRNPKKFRNCY